MSFLRRNADKPDPVGTEGSAAEDTDSAGSAAVTRRRFPGGRVGVALTIAVGMVAFGAAFDFVTASPRLCASCHEMQPKAAEWVRSGHAQVKCVSCHVGAYQWYERPQSLLARGRLLARDSVKHVTNRFTDPVVERPAGVDPMGDAICLQCHSANRQATSGFRILIDHPEHAKRNGSCVSCHIDTAHPEPARGRAISLMAQCYSCHGSAEYPEASTDCGVCHPQGYQLRPVSHDETKWQRDHGQIAVSDPSQCDLCHEQTFCTDCHGLAMPHPDGWEQGANGHAAYAETDRAVCSKCHSEKPDLCSMCHHKAFDPAKGTWIRQHYLEARRKGAIFCLDCHSPVFCAICHARQ